MPDASDPLELVIFGASGFASEIAAWAESATWKGRGFRLCGLIDDVEPDRTLNGRPVWRLTEAVRRHPDAAVLAAVGDPRLRERLIGLAQEAGLRVAPPLLHPTVDYERDYVSFGAGCVICRGTTLTTNITVGAHAQINLHCTIGHGVELQEFATLAPGVHISGKVVLEHHSYLGTGAVTVDGAYDRSLVVGAGAIVGAGAVVARDVAPGVTVVGVPARELRRS